MISWRMTAAWVAALVVATVLAWQIVGLADSQVGDTPVAVAPSLTSTTADGTGSTTLSSTSTSTTDAGPTTTTLPGDTTTSSVGSSTSPSTASTSSSSSSTSSTTTSEQWSLRTVSTSGGVVVVRYRTGEVELQAATPVPGFSVEVDDAGPPRVRVEFESESAEVRVEARWIDGSLDIDVDD